MESFSDLEVFGVLEMTETQAHGIETVLPFLEALDEIGSDTDHYWLFYQLKEWKNFSKM